MKKVAMIGCGKLGKDCAEVMAKYYDVVGYDTVPVESALIKMQNSIEDAVKDRDLIFIAAPTPHDPEYGGEAPTSHLVPKDFDYSIVGQILKEVNQFVSSNQLVILISTVLPGTVRRQLRPLITNARFIYNPYLIAMGTVKHDMVNPEMVIIGTQDGDVTTDASELIEFYKVFMQNDPRYVVGTWDEAESIKIFYNTFISAKIGLVNMIQDVAESNGNINVDVVTKALAESTHRIMGPAYMKAGMGDGGACHPRDNIALRFLAQNLDLGYDMFDSIMHAREMQAKKLAEKCLSNGNNITIIGKSYKPNVPYINGSYSLLVGHYIVELGGNVNYYDPLTGDNDLRKDWTHVYLLAHSTDISILPENCVIIDPWRTSKSTNGSYEIIHYGNTRQNWLPTETLRTQTDFLKKNLVNIYPELKAFQDQIHYIFAGPGSELNFLNRPTESIIKEILEALATGKTYIVFDDTFEPLTEQCLLKITRIADIIHTKLPPSRIFYVTGSLNGNDAYQKFLQKHNSNIVIQIISASSLELIAKNYVLNEPSLFNLEYKIAVKPKKFVCFNRVAREHRVQLLEKNLARNLVKDAFYSFEGLPTDWINHADNCVEIQKISNSFPLRLNIGTERPNPAQVDVTDLDYHTKSYFSVVTETTFYHTNRKNGFQQLNENSIFPTEKIFRPIAMKHPFIVVSVPKFLVALRDLGYKTFDPFINEDYDSIVDDDMRLEFIANEIERLCKFTDQEWIKWQQHVAKIVDYNHKQLVSKSKHSVNTDITTMFKK